MHSPTRDILFIQALRAIGVLCVTWAHLAVSFPSEYHLDALPLVTGVRFFVTGPLGIIQDFGWMGVCLFFLVSGFVIAHVADRHTAVSFLVKRLLRIYPPLWGAILVALLLDPALRAAGIAKILLGMSLLNYFTVPQTVLLGVAWTLVIEISFYALIFLFFRLRHDPLMMIALELLFVWAMIVMRNDWGDHFFLFAAVCAYLPYLITGQIFYHGIFKRTIHPAVTVLLLAGAFAILLFGLTTIHTQFLPLNHSYLLSFGYACFLFLVLLSLRPKRLPAWIAYLADVSYPLYLLHGTVGWWVFLFVLPFAGTAAAALVAFAGSVLAGDLLHRTVELPSVRLGNRVTRKFRSLAVDPLQSGV
ncbi:acyltransferase [Candidatus Peregrinibacteria bacterium]|nr:acyltransferase [Candidatus Peregrinibacteria bacterium]